MHAQRLALATHLLGARGYSVYIPMIANERRRGATELLFPGYGFIAAQPQWSGARFCPGVIKLIGQSEDGPTQIPDAVIDGLKAREKRGLVVLPDPPRLRPGCRVRVTTGLFSGRMGVVALHRGMNGAEKLVVLMGMLRVEIARGAIEVI